MIIDEKELPRMLLVKWSMMSEWYCVADDVTEDELAAFVTGVQATPEQIKQRLYGGFACERKDRVHVFHNSGAYTYLGMNFNHTPEERQEDWERLMSLHEDQPFTHGTIFTHDAPGGNNANRQEKED